jgi:multidrug efflux pump subunit AcrA (membrane-fusion protein)
VHVTAYPNQPFSGQVLKIEPLAKEEESVTTFSVLIRLANPGSLLRPGMNADVEIRVAERTNVLAVPTVALKTPREIATAARAVGVTEEQVQGQLQSAGARPPGEGRPVQPAPRAERPRRPGNGYQYGARYWVFVERSGAPVAVNVTTGLTDLEYSEVLEGLVETDAVVLLPSTGLLQSQQRAREAMRRFSFVPGVNRQEGGSRAGR